MSKRKRIFVINHDISYRISTARGQETSTRRYMCFDATSNTSAEWHLRRTLAPFALRQMSSMRAMKRIFAMSKFSGNLSSRLETRRLLSPDPEGSRRREGGGSQNPSVVFVVSSVSLLLPISTMWVFHGISQDSTKSWQMLTFSLKFRCNLRDTIQLRQGNLEKRRNSSDSPKT